MLAKSYQNYVQVVLFLAITLYNLSAQCQVCEFILRDTA